MAVITSLVLFLAMYAVISAVYDRTAREEARNMARVIAKDTLTDLVQLMRKGATREELKHFIELKRSALAQADYDLRIFRGEKVEAEFGHVVQPEPDAAIVQAISEGKSVERESGNKLRHVYPLQARGECLACHASADPGDQLGAIEIRQDLSAMLQRAHGNFMLTTAAISPLPFAAALLVALWVNRRINRSIAVLERNVTHVNSVSDLKHVALEEIDIGFTDLEFLFHQMQALVARLSSFAVDKELLEFDLRLMEKFMITSEVVYDWRSSANELLLEINRILPAYCMFTVFQVEDDAVEAEIFWHCAPSGGLHHGVEARIRDKLSRGTRFSMQNGLSVRHNVADPKNRMDEIEPDTLTLETKRLAIDTPRITGIVGIGCDSAVLHDETRMLMTQSALSTLINVAGSVKAINKYTRDLEYYAARDPLTNLYNQRAFWELLDHEIARAQRRQYKFALLVIDLDNFKSINDTYGHSFGDDVLRDFAREASQAVREGDVLARYGGDEFVALLPDLSEESPWAVAERIRHRLDGLTLRGPDGQKAVITISIGVAVYPDHAREPNDLFLFADQMMFKAKSEGKNRVCVPGERELIDLVRRMGEETQMILRAVEEERVFPHFQPICHLPSGQIFGHEVLSRLQSPEGVLEAARFAERLEQLGVIHKLDYLMLDKALEQAGRERYPGLLFFNLSPRLLVLDSFIRDLTRLVDKHQADPSRIVFEITERDTVRSLHLLEGFVETLKRRGFKFAIDDFGSGFASYYYVKRFPVDFVKIEGDFITNMVHDRRDRAFVDSITTLARQLGIQCIAEHVETREVLKQVSAMGFEYAQGFYLGEPREQMIDVPLNHRK